MTEPWKYCAKWKKVRHRRPYTAWVHLHEMSRIGKSIQKESRLVVSRVWERAELGEIANRYGVSFGGSRNILKSDSDEYCTTLWIYDKPLHCTLQSDVFCVMWVLSQQKIEKKKTFRVILNSSTCLLLHPLQLFSPTILLSFPFLLPHI